MTPAEILNRNPPPYGGVQIFDLENDTYAKVFEIFDFGNTTARGGGHLRQRYTRQVSDMLRENKIDELFEYLEALAESLENENAEERVRRLYGYLHDNKNGLVPYLKRDLVFPELQNGLVYKVMGNGEHNMFLVVAKRMKHRGASFSPQSGLKLCKLLCHKVSNTLVETIESLTRFEASEHL